MSVCNTTKETVVCHKFRCLFMKASLLTVRKYWAQKYIHIKNSPTEQTQQQTWQSSSRSIVDTVTGFLHWEE